MIHHQDDLTDQQMEERVHDSLRFRATLVDSINTSLPLRFVNCCAKDKTLEMATTVSSWTRNTSGNMQGGVIATAFDISFGILCKAVTEAKRTATISMQINYCKPVPIGTELHIQATINSIGKTILHVEAKAWNESDSDRILATASAVFHRS